MTDSTSDRPAYAIFEADLAELHRSETCPICLQSEVARRAREGVALAGRRTYDPKPEEENEMGFFDKLMGLFGGTAKVLLDVAVTELTGQTAVTGAFASLDAAIDSQDISPASKAALKAEARRVIEDLVGKLIPNLPIPR